MDERALLASIPRTLYVNGQWHDASTGAMFPVLDPASDELLVEVADAGPDDGLAALGAAHDAQAAWAATPPRYRAELLRAMYDGVTRDGEEFALLISLEMGKSIAEARAEVAYAAEYLRWFSEEAARIRGEYLRAPAGTGRILTVPRPVGPCLFITPWNFPLAMATRKIAPALAAGCTTVLKPAQQTPLASLLFATVCDAVGTPPGVVNVVTTTSSGALAGPLIADPRLRKLSFTGSTPVGQRLMAQATEQVLRVSMELGGNAPFLVFEDADLDGAIDGAVIAKMRNIGQSCVAANRFLVHRSLYDRFADGLAERLGALAVGPGTSPGVDVGPLIDAAAVASVHELVTEAVADGAMVLTGGQPLAGPGNFYPPTVLRDVLPAARLVHEEIFGPVAPIVAFDDEQEAIERANETPFGLASYVFTADLKRAMRLADHLEAGIVGVNRGLISDPAAPFGGVKHSGQGKEGGAQGIDDYTELRYVALEA